MFCTNCGAQIEDGSKFCSNCGTPIAAPVVPEPIQEPEEPVVEAAAVDVQEQFEQPAEPQEQIDQPAEAAEPQIAQADAEAAAEPQEQIVQPAEPAEPQTPPAKKKSKGLLIGIIAGAVALVAIILVLLFAVFKIGKPTIDFTKYVKVEYSGYNGGGQARASMDRERFLNDYAGKIKYAPKYRSLESEEYPAAEELIDFFVFCSTDSDKTDLKNGDEVICSLYVDPTTTELFNINLKNKKAVTSGAGLAVPVTVEGLEEAELFDPFEGIKISYTGTEPYGDLEIDWSGCPEPTRYNEYLFEVDKTHNLKNGDQVTITLDESAIDYFFSQYKMAPSPTTYTFTVEGIPALLTSLSDINATAMSEFVTACDKIVDEDYVQHDPNGITTTNYKYAGCILQAEKDPSRYANNTLVAVYEVNNLVENTAPYTVYIAYSFDNVGLLDGKLVFDADDYDAEFHSVKIPAGDWDVTEYYGFVSIDDVKSHFIKTDDTARTYETNLP